MDTPNFMELNSFVKAWMNPSNMREIYFGNITNFVSPNKLISPIFFLSSGMIILHPQPEPFLNKLIRFLSGIYSCT